MEEWSRSVTEPLNLYTNIRMEWKVASRDGYLEIYLSCEHCVGHPSSILSKLACALIPTCPHDRASPLHRPDPNSCYINFFSLAAHGPKASNTEKQVDVLGVDGNTDMQMFVMSALSATEMPIVIRDNACLQCCLDVCRDAGYRYLIC